MFPPPRGILPANPGPLSASGRGPLAGSRGPAAAPAPPVTPVRVVELSGSGYQRGLQHGRALRAEIGEAVRRWQDDLQATRKLDPGAVIAGFLRDTDFVTAIRRWTPELLEEVRGIAEGSGQPFETMLTYQCADEIWVYGNAQAHHCSGVGIARQGRQPARVAQNLDLESFREGAQALLHIHPIAPEPEQYVFTAAGLIAATGMNSAPVAVCVNTLMQLSASRDGLPVAFVIRGLLARRSGPEVLGFLKRVKHASGQNYIIGIGDRVYDFEASASRVTRFRPVPGGSRVFHTNHPLANRDLKPGIDPDHLAEDSAIRFASLYQRFGRSDADGTEAALKAALRSRDSEWAPVCNSLVGDRSWFTFGSVVMTLSDAPAIQVTHGPPDACDYALHAFDAAPWPGSGPA